MRTRFYIFFLLLGLLFLSLNRVNALESLESEEITSEEELDELLANSEISQEFYDEYKFLLTHPLELNSATYSEILTVPYIEPYQALKIIAKRPFSSVSEIKDVVGEEVFFLIQPLIRITPQQDKWLLWLRFEANDDFEDDEKADMFFRMRGSYKQRIFFGLRGEAEEKIYTYEFRDEAFYADDELNRLTLKKAYFGLENIGLLQKLVIGSYSLRFGRGVTLNSAHRRKGEGIFYDYNSTERYTGIASTFRLARFIYPTLFYSDSERSYTVSAYSDDKKANRSLPKIYGQNIWGGRLGLRWSEENRLGYTFYHELVRPRNDVIITGFEDYEEISVSGGDFQYDLFGALLGGEVTQVARGESAYYLDVLAHQPQYSLYSAFRYYPEDYVNPEGYGIASADDEPNDSDEVGIFLELKNKFGRNYTLISSFDQWRHPSSLITDKEIATTLIARPVRILSVTAKHRARDTDIFKSGYRYYYSSIKPQLTLHKLVKLTFYYQLREYYPASEIRELDDSYYGHLRLNLPDGIDVTSRLKYYIDNRLADNESISREWYLQLRTKLRANFSYLIKYTTSEDLIPSEYPTTRYKFQLDWRT